MEQNDDRCHKAITVKVNDREEEIDEVLAPLIQALWELDIETMMSCQEFEPGIAWVEFESVGDFVRFANLVAHYEPGADSLYNRINYQLTGDMSAPLWDCQLNFCDMNKYVDYQGNTDFHLTVGVYFPISDLPTILQRLTEVSS